MPQGQYPTILAGASFTAGLLDEMLPYYAWKTANESVTSSATLQNDNDLYLTVAANAYYDFACMLAYSGGTIGSSDLKWAWSVPSGTTMAYAIDGVQTSGTSNGTPGFLRGVSGGSAGTNGSGNALSLNMEGTLYTGSASGSVQLEWAQNTSNGTATIVQSGSRLRLRRMG